MGSFLNYKHDCFGFKLVPKSREKIFVMVIYVSKSSIISLFMYNIFTNAMYNL